MINFSKGLVILTILATFFLTVSALTQDDFTATDSDEKVVSKESVKENQIATDKVDEKILSPTKEQDSQTTTDTQVPVKTLTIQDFLNTVNQPVESEIDISDIEEMARNTQKEIPSISKKTKEAATKDVVDKIKNSNELNVIVWVKKESNYKKVISELKNFKVKYIYKELNGFAGTANKDNIEHLKKDKRIDYLAFDAPVKKSLIDSIPLIKGDLVASQYNLHGEGMGICHLDTGINYNVPEIAVAYAGGFDFVNNDSDPFDDNGHGTVTAGVIVSTDQTFKGVAPQAKLYVAKVLGASGFGFSSDVTAGINWCITNKDIFNISVISASIATYQTFNESTNPGYSEPALQAAYNANIPVVACAGNTGDLSGVAYPAVSPFAIPVGGVYDSNVGPFNYNFPGGNFSCSDATTQTDKIACFSNRASFMKLVAPASIITTTSWFGGVMNISGTSVASPHVAAVIALMKQRNPEMTVNQIKDILYDTGSHIQDPATGLTFSRIDALEAVEAVPYITTSGTYWPGNTITLHLNDPSNAGKIYFAVLSFGKDYGIPLPNGLTLHIDPDGLFTYSLSPNSLISNNIGFLDSNGQATVTVTIPPIPGIENFPMYTGFATARTDLSQFLSVSNTQKL